MKGKWWGLLALAACLATATPGLTQDSDADTTASDPDAAAPDATEPERVPSAVNVDWRSLEPELQQYFCLQEPPPAWCTEWRGRPAVDPEFPMLRPDEIPRPAWKPKYWHIKHSVWNQLIETLKARPPTRDDILTMHVRAFEDGDTDAMEMLGYAFSAGWGVVANYRRAYEYYALAYLAGIDRVKSNLDAVWPFLSPEDQATVTDRFQDVARMLGRTY